MEIMAWRNLRGWTQKELAYHSGLSAKSISLYERGRKPNKSSQKALASAFGCSISDLYIKPNSPFGIGEIGDLKTFARIVTGLVDLVENNPQRLSTIEKAFEKLNAHTHKRKTSDN